MLEGSFEGRSTIQLGIRVAPEIGEHLHEAALKTGCSKRLLLELLIEKHLDQLVAQLIEQQKAASTGVPDDGA